MKHTKDRVIAIDYFRGICILIVLLSHSIIFSMPFAYLSGAGKLWTGAAEMFFLLSGLTLGIVRGKNITTDFSNISKKIWRRAIGIYLINILAVAASLLLALTLVSHNLANDVVGSLPSSKGLSLLWSIVNLSYAIGWASFLACYAIYMIFAPFALYGLRTRFGYLVPLVSLGLFTLNYINPSLFGYASSFAVWQFYFVAGMVLARFRVSIISYMYSLKVWKFNTFRGATLLITGGFLGFNLLSHLSFLDTLFMNNRAGLLRPIAALFYLASAYLIYQTYKRPILSYTGRFVNTMGRDTLWIFVAQAFAIPLLAAIPLQRNLFNNSLLTATLILLMWSLTKRRAVLPALSNYWVELKTSYNTGKYNYLYRSENDA
jgi:hypothetical protein